MNTDMLVWVWITTALIVSLLWMDDKKPSAANLWKAFFRGLAWPWFGLMVWVALLEKGVRRATRSK